MFWNDFECNTEFLTAIIISILVSFPVRKHTPNTPQTHPKHFNWNSNAMHKYYSKQFWSICLELVKKKLKRNILRSFKLFSNGIETGRTMKNKINDQTNSKRTEPPNEGKWNVHWCINRGRKKQQRNFAFDTHLRFSYDCDKKL